MDEENQSCPSLVTVCERTNTVVNYYLILISLELVGQ
jgi:hypothetical protein